MPRRSTPQGADPNSRLGDPTSHKLHYQTGPIGPVNSDKPRSSRQLTRDRASRNLIEPHAPPWRQHDAERARRCDQATRSRCAFCD